jgi:predicted O-methyltransferase YrrM/ribosomal protein S18 acetylase RimI-like enzyme
MNDSSIRQQPGALPGIIADTEALSFGMISEPKVGSLLATLAASKPNGRFLELGTGTGHGTAWLLAGMDSRSTLDTVDTDPRVAAVAKRHLGSDSRVRFHLVDGAAFLTRGDPHGFDLIYADAWPGKFSHLDEALALLRRGGMYVIDDLLPQPNWPDGHAPKVPQLMDDLEHRPGFVTIRLAWASGLMIVVRCSPDTGAGPHAPMTGRGVDDRVQPVDPRDAMECADLMVASEPWLTLRLSREAARAVLTDPAKEVYAIRDAIGVAAFVVIDMRGLLRGYVQILCVRTDSRRQGLGSALLRFAEERIFRHSPNVFICVSSFNTGARRLYERCGFELVGTLHQLLVPGHDELLLRKTKGSWEAFRQGSA